jgi:hypothetical protein
MNPTILDRKSDTEGTLDSNNQFVNGVKLLQILFPEECRPTMRWLRDQQKARRIPFVKVGRLVFFCPAQVRAALERNSSFCPRTARAA